MKKKIQRKQDVFICLNVLAMETMEAISNTIHNDIMMIGDSPNEIYHMTLRTFIDNLKKISVNGTYNDTRRTPKMLNLIRKQHLIGIFSYDRPYEIDTYKDYIIHEFELSGRKIKSKSTAHMTFKLENKASVALFYRNDKAKFYITKNNFGSKGWI